MGWGVMLGAAQGTWGHLPPTFALGSFVSGSPAREGKTRASFGRWGDSFPRRNETGQEWISNEPGKGIRKGRAAPSTAQPCGRMAPFPALLGESRGKPGAPRVGQGCGGNLGSVWAVLGAHRSRPCACGEGETEAQPQCRAEGIPGKAPCGNQLDPEGSGSKKQVPDGSWVLPWGSRASCQCQRILEKVTGRSFLWERQGMWDLSRDGRKEGGAGFWPGAEGMQTPGSAASSLCGPEGASALPRSLCRVFGSRCSRRAGSERSSQHGAPMQPRRRRDHPTSGHRGPCGTGAGDIPAPCGTPGTAALIPAAAGGSRGEDAPQEPLAAAFPMKEQLREPRGSGAAS